MPAGPPPIKRPRGKAPWIIACLAAALLLVIVGAVAFARYFDRTWADLPEPPDETGLERFAETVPDEDNAYTHYLRAADSTVLDEAYVDRYWDEDIEESPSSTLLDDLHREYADVFQHYANALAAPASIAPRGISLDEYPSPDTERAHDFDTLLYLHVNQRFYQGDQREALEDALDYARLGRRLMDAHGPYFVYQEGAELTTSALNSFADLVQQCDLDNDAIANFEARISGLSDDGAALRNSLVETYHAVIDTIAAAFNPNIEETFGDENTITSSVESQRQYGFLAWRPNRTRAKALETIRPLVDSAHKPYDEMPRDVIPESEDMELKDVLGFFKPNGASDFIVRYYLSDLHSTIAHKAYHNTCVALAQTACAFKMYHNDHADLPPTLAALVPNYLDSPPGDDFNGETLRYNTEEGIVYSVGADLRDAGGEPGDQDYDEIVLDVGYLWPDSSGDALGGNETVEPGDQAAGGNPNPAEPD